MLLGQMTHEAMQRDKIPLSAMLHGASERDQSSIGASPQSVARRWIITHRPSVSFPPRFDVFDGVLLLFPERSQCVLRLLLPQVLLLLCVSYTADVGFLFKRQRQRWWV